MQHLPGGQQVATSGYKVGKLAGLSPVKSVPWLMVQNDIQWTFQRACVCVCAEHDRWPWRRQTVVPLKGRAEGRL